MNRDMKKEGKEIDSDIWNHRNPSLHEYDTILDPDERLIKYQDVIVSDNGNCEYVMGLDGRTVKSARGVDVCGGKAVRFVRPRKTGEIACLMAKTVHDFTVLDDDDILDYDKSVPEEKRVTASDYRREGKILLPVTPRHIRNLIGHDKLNQVYRLPEQISDISGLIYDLIASIASNIENVPSEVVGYAAVLGAEIGVKLEEKVEPKSMEYSDESDESDEAEQDDEQRLESIYID